VALKPVITPSIRCCGLRKGEWLTVLRRKRKRKRLSFSEGANSLIYLGCVLINFSLRAELIKYTIKDVTLVPRTPEVIWNSFGVARTGVSRIKNHDTLI